MIHLSGKSICIVQYLKRMYIFWRLTTGHVWPEMIEMGGGRGQKFAKGENRCAHNNSCAKARMVLSQGTNTNINGKNT